MNQNSVLQTQDRFGESQGIRLATRQNEGIRVVKLNSYLSTASKLILLLATGLFSAQALANIVNDPSFEGTTANWDLDDANTVFVNSPVRTGTQALQLTHLTDRSRTVYQVNAAPVEAGKEYTYDVWVTGNGLTGTGKPLALVRWRDAAGQIIKTGDTNISQESFRFANLGTYGYTQASMLMHIQAPGKAASVDIGFRAFIETTAGTSTWDDVNMRLRTQNFAQKGDRLASYEVEDAAILTGGDLESAHIDYSKNGYYDVHTDGAVIEWNNVVSGTGRTVAIRFSWEGNARPIQLLINGVLHGSSTPIPTGRRGTWATHIFTGVNLPNASNTVRLIVGKTGGEKSQPMIDKLDIHAAGNETTPANVPMNVAASNLTHNDKIEISWDPVIGASRYEIIRSLVSGQIGSFYTSSAGNVFEDKDVDELTSYYYRVRACNDTTCTVLSPQVEGQRDVNSTRLDLAVTNTSTTIPVNLTNIGVTDWAHYGLDNKDSVNVKAGVTTIIPPFTKLNGANPQQQISSRADYTWTDGIPTAGTTTDNGLQMFDPEVGLQWVLPADTAQRTFILYAGVNTTSGTISASLSDGSRPAVQQTVSSNFKAARTFTIDYAAASAGQTLTVTWEKPHATGSIQLDAVALIVPNSAPTITPISNQSATEGLELVVPLNASDPDGPAPITFSETNTLPGSPNILTDNGDGTGSISWTPSVGDSANDPFSVTVTAADGTGASTSETFSIAVNPNAAPVITTITDKTVIAGNSLIFSVDANDPDGPAPIVLTQSNNLPGSPNILTDLGNGDGTIAWLSSSGDEVGSPYQITITATDGAGAARNETLNVVVTASAPPILNPIGDRNVIENRLLTFSITASDNDGPTPLSFSETNSLPGNPSVLTDNGNGTATFNYTPAFGQMGTYPVTVTVSDFGGTTASETFNVIVAPNQPPSLASISSQVAVENQQLVVPLNATDVDGPLPLVLTATDNLPGTPTIQDNGDGTGEFRYTPQVGENSPTPFNVTITVTDDDGATDTESFTVTINANTPPVLTPIGDQTVRELATLSIPLNAPDIDGPLPLTLSQTNTLPGTPTNLISDNGDGTGTLNWTPAANDHLSSPFTITVTATDGEGLNVSETFNVTVLPQGTGGTLNGSGAVMPGTVSLPNVGTTDWVHLGRNAVATAVNRKAGITPIIGPVTPLPGTTPFAGNNAFTDYSWFNGTPVAADGIERNGLRVLADTRGYTFSVPAGISTRTVKVYLGARNAFATLTASLSDASAPNYTNTISATVGKIGRVVTIDYAAGLPGQTLDVTVFMDGPPLQSNSFVGLDAITLVGSNLSPVISPIADQTIVENQPFTLAVTATDDGPVPLTLTATNTLPGNPAIFTDNGGGSGTINYTPAVGDAGTYNVVITATDFDGESSIESFTLTVAANTAPDLSPIADTSAIEGQLLTFPVTATDTDGPTPLTLTATSNIPGSPNVLTDNGNGSGTIGWTPASGLAGGSPYTITVTATDGDGLTDVESFQVTLTASAPPVLNPIGDLTLVQNRLFALAISGTDPDGPPLAFSDTNNIGQSLISNDDGQGNANLVWTPPNLGTFTETVTLTDGTGTTDSETITITVVPNTPPVLNPIGNRTVIKNSSLFFNISATDPDSGSTVSFSQTNTFPGNPANILTDNNDNTATILWTAGDLVNDPGNPFSVTVTATDVDGGATSETFTVEVTDSSAPVLNPIGTQTAVEQLPLDLVFTATDSDGPTPLVVSQTNTLPGTVNFTDNGNGTANFSWTPAVGDAAGAPYSVTVTVADGGNTTTTETFVVNVTANASPVLAPIGEQTAVENALFTLNISATDDGAAPVSFSQTNTLPGTPNILTDNNDGTATLSYTPGLDERLNSPYSVTITVTDENGTTDSETIVFNVVRGGRLTGASAAAAATINLTNLGIDDWIHWGLGSNEAVNRKSGVPLAEQISDFVPINGANPQTFTLTKAIYTWTDGDPTQSSTNRSSVRIFDIDKGVRITLPASRSERRARVYVGGTSATGTLTATLSDSSAPVFQTTLVAGSKVTQEIELTYRSGSQNQTLTIDWVKSTAGGSITLEATTLENLNDPPSVPTIGNQNAVENQLLSIPLVATDVDGPDPIVFSQSNNLPGLPNILTDNGDGTGSLDWTPAVGDAGTYQVTLTYADDVGESDSQTFSISVAANTPPTITPIDDIAITELESLSIPVNSTDADGPTPLVLTQTNDLPGTPNFVDNGDGTGLFTWSPSTGDSAQSPFTITFTATDGDNEATTRKPYGNSLTEPAACARSDWRSAGHRRAHAERSVVGNRSGSDRHAHAAVQRYQ